MKPLDTNENIETIVSEMIQRFDAEDSYSHNDVRRMNFDLGYKQALVDVMVARRGIVPTSQWWANAKPKGPAPADDTTLPLRFRGNGKHRITALPQHIVKGTQPTKLSVSQCRMLCGMFAKMGRSEHSAHGATLWVSLEYCEHNGIAFELKIHTNENAVVRDVASASVLGYSLIRVNT